MYPLRAILEERLGGPTGMCLLFRRKWFANQKSFVESEVSTPLRSGTQPALQGAVSPR